MHPANPTILWYEFVETPPYRTLSAAPYTKVYPIPSSNGFAERVGLKLRVEVVEYSKKGWQKHA
jgi:hypothetical protein